MDALGLSSMPISRTMRMTQEPQNGSRVLDEPKDVDGEGSDNPNGVAMARGAGGVLAHDKPAANPSQRRARAQASTSQEGSNDTTGSVRGAPSMAVHDERRQRQRAMTRWLDRALRL